MSAIGVTTSVGAVVERGPCHRAYGDGGDGVSTSPPSSRSARLTRRVMRETRGFTRAHDSNKPISGGCGNRVIRPVKADGEGVDQADVPHPSGDPAFTRALETARAGHSPGFEWLWNRFARQVVAFASAQGSEDAEGLCNEVFLGAFGRLDQFVGGEDGFVSMLFSITRNKIVDERRRRGRRVETREIEPRDDRSGGDVEAEVLERVGGHVPSILATLTDEQREVLHLRLIADLSLEQTAEVTGRSVNAVKAMQHRATNTLRRTISEEAVTR